MKIETQTLDDHQVKLTVEVEAEPLEEARRRAARTIARKTKIPGFRPGKAPYNVIQRFVGAEAILDEALDILVKDLYPQIIDESGVQPYGPGKLDNIATLDPLSLEFTVPLSAKVQLGDYLSIRLPYEYQSVTDEQVDEVVNNLRQRQAIEEPAGRPALEGDRVSIRLSAQRVLVTEGVEPTLIRERPFSTIIQPEETDQTDEWPFPGFSRKLLGLRDNEFRSFSYTFPEDSDLENLRGVTAEFNFKADQVKTHRLPELNDEFAKSIGDYEDVETWGAEIHPSLEKTRLEEYNDEFDTQVINQIIEISTIQYPPQMLEHEIDEVIHQLEHRLSAQKLDLETYKKTRKIDDEGLRAEAAPVAITRLKRSLVLLEVAAAETIEVDKDDLQSETERTMEALTRFMSESELRKMSSDKLLPSLVGNIMAEMRVNLTRERLRSIARGEMEFSAVEASEEEIPETNEEAGRSPLELAVAGNVTESENATPQPKPVGSRKKKTKPNIPEGGSPLAVQSGEFPGE